MVRWTPFNCHGHPMIYFDRCIIDMDQYSPPKVQAESCWVRCVSFCTKYSLLDYVYIWHKCRFFGRRVCHCTLIEVNATYSSCLIWLQGMLLLLSRCKYSFIPQLIQFWDGPRSCWFLCLFVFMRCKIFYFFYLLSWVQGCSALIYPLVGPISNGWSLLKPDSNV